MSTDVITLEGIVRPDGTLEIAEKVNLPAGKVQVTLVPMPDLPPDDPFWQTMQRIWAGQRARGHAARAPIRSRKSVERCAKSGTTGWRKSPASRKSPTAFGAGAGRDDGRP